MLPLVLSFCYGFDVVRWMCSERLPCFGKDPESTKILSFPWFHFVFLHCYIDVQCASVLSIKFLCPACIPTTLSPFMERIREVVVENENFVKGLWHLINHMLSCCGCCPWDSTQCRDMYLCYYDEEMNLAIYQIFACSRFWSLVRKGITRSVLRRDCGMLGMSRAYQKTSVKWHVRYPCLVIGAHSIFLLICGLIFPFPCL